MLGLTINTSNNSKFKIYPFNSNNEIFYSIKINDNSNSPLNKVLKSI